MTSECYHIDALVEIDGLAPDDPRRRHLETCARCRARLATYVEFIEAPPAVTGRQRQEAIDRLGAALDREIFSAAIADARPVQSRGPRFDWQRCMGLLWRPAGALAAAAVVVAVGLTVLQAPRETERIVLRSDEGGAVGARLEPASPVWRADGSLRLTWGQLPGADTHHIEILGPELDLVATLDAGPDTVRIVSPGELSRLFPDPGTYAWTVTALAGGDVLERSRPVALAIEAARLPAVPPRGDIQPE